MRLNRKEFLELVGCGAAASVAAACRRCPGRGRRDSARARRQAEAKEVQRADIKGTTDAVRRFIATSSLKDMPADVVTQGKRCLIDNFGVLLAGSTAEGSHILRQYAQKVERNQGSHGARARAAGRLGGACRAGQRRQRVTRSTTTTRSCRRHRTVPSDC